MGNREFSDTTKLDVIKANLEKNEGEIHCEICDKKLASISECHFDHIHPFAKGGRSIFLNCQILCVECNLKKNDKELKEFILEEKAKRFFAGEDVTDYEKNVSKEAASCLETKMTKELFDEMVSEFIAKKGDIHKVDFSRAYNGLPSIHYVRQYYGDLNSLKKEFGIEDISLNWDREKIADVLKGFVLDKGTISQKDLVKANRMPSLPCILKYFPEYKNFSDVKRGLCDLYVQETWTVERAIIAGQEFAKTSKRITQKDLGVENHLPSSSVIIKLFGSMADYQKAVGVEISQIKEFISKEEISKAVDIYFQGKERIVESQTVFFEGFPYSSSTISKRYGLFSDFCKEYGIKVLCTKKAKYTKREVDDAISAWMKEGNKIPLAKELAKVGLPSQSVILKYYEDWREPFYLYKKLYEEVKRMDE